MKVVYPVRFDRKISGRDADGNRLTNILGFDGQELLKQCPNCKRVLPSSVFGQAGRPNGFLGRRDQSWCSDCRHEKDMANSDIGGAANLV